MKDFKAILLGLLVIITIPIWIWLLPLALIGFICWGIGKTLLDKDFSNNDGNIF